MTNTISDLLTAYFTDKDESRLPIIADALEEDGKSEVANRLRGWSIHVQEYFYNWVPEYVVYKDGVKQIGSIMANANHVFHWLEDAKNYIWREVRTIIDNGHI